jgi:hypothetical protein
MRKTCPLPARLAGVQQRFERWRQSRKGLSHIPEPLWTVAVKMARTYGICRTARTLRVNYDALKKRIKHHTAAVPSMPLGEAGTRFLELSLPADNSLAAPTTSGPPRPADTCDCTLELENGAGAKMRVHLKSMAMPDLTALSRSFWDRRP